MDIFIILLAGLCILIFIDYISNDDDHFYDDDYRNFT